MNTPTQMKAIIFSSPGDGSVIREEIRPVPVVSDTGLLVKVHAFGLNRADLVQRKGNYQPPPGVTDIPGLELAGVVVETGDSVTGFTPGDRVMGLVAGGAYSEYCQVDAGVAWRIPDSVSFETAAALPEMLITCWLNLVEIGHLTEGMSVLIHAGASGIGSAAIQLTKRFGARVAITAGSDEKVNFCKELGADLGINYKTDPDFHKAIRQEWDGVDLILDPVGAGYLDKNISCLKTDGKLILIGLMQGSDARINLGHLLVKRLTVTGSTLRSLSLETKRLLARAVSEQLLPAVWSGEFRVIIDSTFQSEDIADAHRYMEENRNLGKIIVVR